MIAELCKSIFQECRKKRIRVKSVLPWYMLRICAYKGGNNKGDPIADMVSSYCVRPLYCIPSRIGMGPPHPDRSSNSYRWRRQEAIDEGSIHPDWRVQRGETFGIWVSIRTRDANEEKLSSFCTLSHRLNR